MRLAESPEQHFTEGEPDIEPPEELAVSEVDDVALLEEELDNEDVLEQDVEEDVLEETLEDLVHGADDDDAPGRETLVGLVVPVAGEPVAAPEEEGEGDDVEESLDVVLEHRLAGGAADIVDVGEADDDAVAGDGAHPGGRPGEARGHASVEGPGEEDVRPCGPDEFTCRSCFLVHTRELLADAQAMTCRDCT